jgi:hypothetical protein
MLVVAGILTVFVIRTVLARRGEPPLLSDLFTFITLAGSLVVLIAGFRSLQRMDWVIALGLGAVVGFSMGFATLFTAYPVFGILLDNATQGVVRGSSTTLVVLAGLVIMRQGGPVRLLAAGGAWKVTLGGIMAGLAAGLPLAVLNAYALQFSEGQAIHWQNPLAALLDALQPGIVEEVIYRFALWGLLWLALRSSFGAQSALIAGLLATLVHAYGHLDVLLVQAPLAALGMGLVMILFWGLPPFLLARRKGIESAIAFHWIQDVARFSAGF